MGAADETDDVTNLEILLVALELLWADGDLDVGLFEKRRASLARAPYVQPPVVDLSPDMHREAAGAESVAHAIRWAATEGLLRLLERADE